MNYSSVLIKPASSLCNMRCRYCFYHDVANHRETASYGMMSFSTVDCLLKNIFAHTAPPAVIFFTFQGGEPTLAGLGYFSYFTEAASALAPDGVRVSYAIQTNGLVIDEDWCALFKKHDFLVGLSLDGPREFHDCQRLGHDLKGTFDRVNHALRLLKKHQISYNILTVITQQTARKPQTLFRYYMNQRFPYVQLIPCLKPLGGAETQPYDLAPRTYADFMTAIFDLWYGQLQKGNYIGIRQFDNLAWMLRGRPAEQCGLMGSCTPQCIVEADGSVYPCDFYVLDEYKSGSVCTDGLDEIMNAPGTKKFLEFSAPPHRLCDTCKVYCICRGGCRRYRSFYQSEPEYCPYQDFLYRVYPKLADVANHLR